MKLAALSRACLPGSTRIPGIVLCAAVSLCAYFCSKILTELVSVAWLEPLVLAIILGTLLRSVWRPAPRYNPGIDYAAKQILELAVALMGLTVSSSILQKLDVLFIFGIAAVVALAIPVSYFIGRLLGLAPKMAILIACGNAICGNSAIAAVAPAIGARSSDVAAAVAFTAVLSVIVILCIPLGVSVIGLGPLAGGALAGMTVYAVPQVLAAAAPLGTAAVQFGTLVKLIRVLMLAPVVTLVAMVANSKMRPADTSGTRSRNSFHLPWFIVAFIALAALASLGVAPQPVVSASDQAADILTIFAMAALGLSVDLRDIAAAGPRVALTVLFSLFAISLGAVMLITLSGISAS